MKTPWHNEKGELIFPYRAILDRAFIFPDLPPERYESNKRLIEIPEQFRSCYQKGIGTLLSIGPGHQDDKGKWHSTSPELKPGVRVRYDVTVPWRVTAKGLDGKEYEIILCGYLDIYGFWGN